MDETEGGPVRHGGTAAQRRIARVDRPRVIRETVAMTLRSQLTEQCPHRACSTRCQTYSVGTQKVGEPRCRVKRGSRGLRAVLNLHLCERRSGVHGDEMKTSPVKTRRRRNAACAKA